MKCDWCDSTEPTKEFKLCDDYGCETFNICQRCFDLAANNKWRDIWNLRREKK